MATSLLIVAIHTTCLAVCAEWTRLPALPDEHGFAGAFAGVSHDQLLVAGGANFPDRPPWQGGEKIWHDTIFSLDRPDGDWKVAGKLPRPLAYGVSVTHGNAVICVGGGDRQRHYADVFRIELNNGELAIAPLPALPAPVANACGALVGDTLYVAGGLRDPQAQAPVHAIHRIDLRSADPQWERVEPCPQGPRMLAIAASFDDAFWLIGGVDLRPGTDAAPTRHYLSDVYRYDPAQGWQRRADLPLPLAAAPSPAATDATGIVILGGDDGSKAGFTPPELHPGFNASKLRYHAATDRWTNEGTLPMVRVTVPLVEWNQMLVIPSGEVRPGVRSPEVWSLRLTPKEQ